MQGAAASRLRDRQNWVPILQRIQGRTSRPSQPDKHSNAIPGRHHLAGLGTTPCVGAMRPGMHLCQITLLDRPITNFTHVKIVYIDVKYVLLFIVCVKYSCCIHPMLSLSLIVRYLYLILNVKQEALI